MFLTSITKRYMSIDEIKLCTPFRKTVRYNPYVDRFPNFIKHLCVLLVKHGKVITGRGSARKGAIYGNLLVDLSNRTEPPPDLERIQNGFLLHDVEVDYNLTTCALKRNKKKRVLRLPIELSPEEFRRRCDIEIENILLRDHEAINILKNEIAPRYTHLYGGYTSVEFFEFPDANQRPRYAAVSFKDV